MAVQSLNGIWSYRIGKGKFTDIAVPFSRLAVGHSECERSFDLEHSAEKIFLKFDGITYAAKVFVNDTFVGEMGPYCEYKFDVTDILFDKNNHIRVELEDIEPKFGPTAGWENFGGIIHGVELLYLPARHIEDVFFHCELTNEYTSAEYTIELTASADDCEFKAELLYGDKLVSECTGEVSVGAAHGRADGIKLWSPQSPELYRLQVTLLHCGRAIDTYTCAVGFREFKCSKHRFMLNGKPLLIKGVCKHEMFGDSGHCPTEEQIRFDLQMIKDTGCNFVRLVHYPHSKRVIEIADELGLMVSEEPGLWWSDTSDPEVANGALEVLKRTILRDRNHPSIVFWLCFNECIFTEQYLIDCAKQCRRYDPTRPVSGANCMSNEDTLKYYNLCGFDFYTMHPYSQTFDRSREAAELLTDKPLLFTEWGGHFVYDNPKLLGEFINEMYKLYLANSDSGALAGACFWEWSELNDFNRGKPACIDGNLAEGLVDKYRKPTLIYDKFKESLHSLGREYVEGFWIEYENDEGIAAKPLVPKNDKAFSAVLTAVNKAEQEGNSTRKRVLVNGPRLDGVAGLSDIPVVVRDGDVFELDCDITTDELKLYGLTDMLKGYPLGGNYGEEAAELAIHLEDGSKLVFTLKNGIDITTVYELHESSRINPIAESSARAAVFGYEKNFERYVLNKAIFQLGGTKHIKKLSVTSKNNGYAFLLYGFAG